MSKKTVTKKPTLLLIKANEDGTRDEDLVSIDAIIETNQPGRGHRRRARKTILVSRSIAIKYGYWKFRWWRHEKEA